LPPLATIVARERAKRGKPMAEEIGHVAPDVSEMRAVHGVFRDTLGAAPELISAIDPSDTARRDLIANFYENVVSFLRGHHQTEEDLVFPLLRERCADQRAVVERAAEQHEEVVGLVGEAETSIRSLSNGEADSQQRCADALAKLGTTLAVHLDDEEADVLPLCADHMSVEEWSAQPGHGMALFQGDKVWLVLGLIRQRLTEAQRDEMLANMPPPAVEMWTNFGENAFDQLIAEVGPPLG
jgi:hemerythrin-like domain-containing protein